MLRKVLSKQELGSRKPIAWGDRLIAHVREKLSQVTDHRRGVAKIALVDVVMSGFALFSLKDPSLLAFEARRRESESRANLRRVYGIERLPSDTQMREVLDGVAPGLIRPLLKEVVGQVQGQDGLRGHAVLGGYQAVALDGVEHFRSQKVHCTHCTVSHHGVEQVEQYSHRLLVATLVAPGQRTVLPLEAEAVLRSDGTQKNDCEQNAALRLLPRLRQSYPQMRLLLTGDALLATAPLIRQVEEQQMAYILKVKPGSHSHLCEQATRAPQRAGIEVAPDGGAVVPSLTRYSYTLDCALNGANPDCRVNFLDEWRWNQVEQRWQCVGSWATNLPLSDEALAEIVQVARAHWKIENETFNTLKNQGYHFGHNFGHGQQHLATTLALLMLLAFAVDQAQQLLCAYFQAALTQLKENKSQLWERLRHLFYTLPMDSLSHLWRAIAFGFTVQSVQIGDFPSPDSS